MAFGSRVGCSEDHWLSRDPTHLPVNIILHTSKCARKLEARYSTLER